MSEIRRWVALSVVLYCMTLHAGIAFGAPYANDEVRTPAVFVTTQPRFVLTPAGFGAVQPGQVLSLRPDVLHAIHKYILPSRSHAYIQLYIGFGYQRGLFLAI